MQITLRNNTTNYIKYFDNVNVIGSNPLHQLINLNTTDLIDGEYTLELYDDTNNILITELLVIGKKKIKEYNTNKKFTQYVRR
jgi:hypothetical protein